MEAGLKIAFFMDDERTFECSTCHRVEKVSFPVDPMKTDAVGWLASELKRPAAMNGYPYRPTSSCRRHGRPSLHVCK